MENSTTKLNLFLKSPYPCLAVNLIAIILVAFHPDWIFMSAGIVVFLCINSIILFIKSGISKTYRKLRKTEQVSQRRLELIREIINLSMYNEGYSKEWLYKKFCETVCVKKLIHSSVLDLEKESRKFKKIAQVKGLSQDELEFYCLLKAGFTMRELSVMYNLKHNKSVYVKRKRIINKIGKYDELS